MIRTLTIAWMRNGHTKACATQTATAQGDPAAVACLQCLCPDAKYTKRSRNYRRVMKALNIH